MIQITLQSGEARNQIQDLGKMLGRPRPIIQAAVRGTRTRLQRHFTERESRGNKLGGKRTHFWLDVRKSTQVGEVTDRSGFVVIGDPRFAQKVFGGTIVAKTPWRNGFKLLTIPVDPRGYGRRASVAARENNIKLFFMGTASGGVLATKAGAGIEVIYACVPSVTQQADPEALPDRQELENAAIDAARQYVATTVKNSQPKA